MPWDAWCWACPIWSSASSMSRSFAISSSPTIPRVKACAPRPRNFYTSGDLAPLIAVLEANHLRVFDNRDYRWSNELTVKTVFLVALFADIFYVMDSETAIIAAMPIYR